MKAKKLSPYSAIFVITLFGAAATLFIIDASKSLEMEAEYANIDTDDLVNADFGS